jgi:hypothetical protein
VYEFVIALTERVPAAGTIQTVIDYRNRRDAAVTAVSLYIRARCPEARLETSFVRYEDENAYLGVTLPATLTVDERENWEHSPFCRVIPIGSVNPAMKRTGLNVSLQL